MGPLFERLQVCGPTLDPAAADRVREVVLEEAVKHGWRDTLEAAWPSLAPIFAASPYLATIARRSPDRLRRVLAADPDALCRQIINRAASASGPIEPGEAERNLRRLKGDLHLLTALADVGRVWDLEEVTNALSGFADAALAVALLVAAREAMAAGRIARLGESEEGPLPGFFCLAMGKLGACELNYSSDIDISVFYEPGALPLANGAESVAVAVQITERIADILRRRTVDGYVFRVDLRLRPDPLSTPVAVSTPAAFEYYESVGQNWERAAFIKARVAAGDLAVGSAFLRELEPFIWRRNLDFAAIADIHAIKRQIHSHKMDERLTAAGADLKLGPGGIREVEFYVQTQQLILGGRHRDLRAPATLPALEALHAHGHAPARVAAEMADDYRELRRLEHRVQMVSDEQTHVLPQSDAERRRIAVLAGANSLRALDRSVGALLTRVNRHSSQLFAGEEPLSSRFGTLVFTGVDDDPETLATLRRMGFADPAAITAEIRAWRRGAIGATRSERGREAFTRLAPRLLDAAQATGAPDIAFSRFSQFFSGLRSGVQVQSLFLAKPKLLDLIIRIMALAPQFALALMRQPAALDALLDPAFFSPAVDGGLIADAIAGASGFEDGMNIARRLHRETSFRLAVQVLEGMASSELAGRAFAALADAIIRGLALITLQELERVAGGFPGEVAIVALGKCGSSEMTAGSDLDLMTLYRAKPGAVSELKAWSAETYYARFTQRLVAALSAPTAEGGLYEVDLQLRPSGTQGPVSVSLAAFEGYYAADAEVWELLAMTRARVVWATTEVFAQVAERAIETALRRERDPVAAARDVAEMRDLMARERPPAGPWDMKMSPGGLVDIEFCAQYLQIVHAARGGPLSQNTLQALAALERAAVAPRRSLEALGAAFELQQNLSQLLKVSLPDGAEPASEAQGLRTLFARTAGVGRFAAIRPRLNRARLLARQAFEDIVVASTRKTGPPGTEVGQIR